MSDDALVIGAGPVGLACAWSLADAGARVRLLDDGRPAAGWAAAGMLGPWSEAEHRDGAMHELLVRAARTWPDFAARLDAAAGMDCGYATTGTLQVATRPEHIGPLRSHGELVRDLDHPLRWLGSGELRRLEPGLGTRVAGGFALEHEHQVDPRRLIDALRTACRSGDVTIAPGTARELVREDGAVVGVRTGDGDTHRAAQTVLCAGWRSAALADPPAMRPIKGQILRLAGDGTPPPVTRVIRGPDAYVVPRADGEVVVGGTVEERSDEQVTAGAVHALLDAAIDMVPDLGEMSLSECSTGLRPATDDGLPVIGRGDGGLIWAAGGFRHGILLAPVFARAAAMAAAGSDDDDMAPFAPTRTGG